MALKDFMPFRQGAPKLEEKKSAQILPIDDQKALTKAFKVQALAVDFNGNAATLHSRATYEMPEVDLCRIAKAIDTDSYVMQAVNKYKELLWKEGWEIIGENPESIDYLWQRIDFMEIAMGRSFQDFLIEAADQLVRFGNAFIVKRRGPLQDFFPDKLYPPENKDPIVGYYLIPTEQVEIIRDRFNKPRWYRQRRDNVTWSSGGDEEAPKWNAKDVIHLYYNKKIGRAFGTPFLATVLDDVISLRQMEEDIFNLIHRELFPLYKYIIGTDEHPATQEELDNAAFEIEGMRVEGGLILPHRHDVEVIGAEGNALDYTPALAHAKERVAIGLGLFPHHLGMTGSSANRSMTDRLDVALYDKIKTYQQYLSDQIRLQIFNELLFEGGFDPITTPKATGTADRCMFSFREIDVDTQVKKESHTIQKVQQGIETIGEGRQGIGRTPDMDESDTIAARTARLTPDTVTQTKRQDGSPGAPKVVDTTPKAAQQPKALPKGSRGAANMVRPSNQHGTRSSPNIRRSDKPDLGWLEEVESLLGSDYNIIDVESREEDNER